MTEKVINIIKEEPFVGEDGLDYLKVTKEILTPRKTYLKGTISGKYRGDKISDGSDKSNLFDFEIYEAQVTCNSIDDFSKNKPFSFPHDFKNITNANKIKGAVFPKEKLPPTLQVIISAHNITFGINVIDPQLFEFTINRKEHLIEGDQIFGTFNAYITGYVFDYEREEVEEISKVVVKTVIVDPIDLDPAKPCKCSTIETGKTELKGNYIRKEFKCKNHNDNVWGKWEYKKKEPWGFAGCFGQIFSGIILLFGLFFLIKLFPFLLIFVVFYLITLLFGLFAPFLKWIFRVLGIILLLTFLLSLFKTCTNSSQGYVPSPVVVDPREVNPVVIPTADTTAVHQSDTLAAPTKDSIITRFRSWHDYEGKIYKGKYHIKLSDFNNSHNFKNGLNTSQISTNSYDDIIYNLKEFDKNNFNSVYKLFDSIGRGNHLNSIKFAEMIVTFVQDIPYAIVLEDGCDASLYNDRFTRNYLLSHEGECDGNQKFGLNTPVEFLTNLKGDCDTRTLLLYTIFSHYNYDVALLSSEFYGHSIIGINLPINGVAYRYNNQRYVLWETTAKNCKPGVISNEISNLNNWRISLKSK